MTLTRLAARPLNVQPNQSVIRSLLAKVGGSHALARDDPFGRQDNRRSGDFVELRDLGRSRVSSVIFVMAASFDGTHAELTAGEDSTMLCIAKDISHRGIGFKHDKYFDSKWAIVSFDLLDPFTALLLEVRWKNVRTDSDSLMSGGRFVGMIDLP
jgi:hypothetical protein